MEHIDLQSTVIQQQQRIQELETQGQKTAVAAAIGGALDATGLTLQTGAREHLTKLLGDQLAVVPSEGGRVVVAPGGAAVNDWVKTQLTQGNYGHFIRGGGSAAAAGGPQVPAGEPNNMSEAVIMQVKAAAAARPAADGRLDPRVGFGLGRRG